MDVTSSYRAKTLALKEEGAATILVSTCPRIADCETVVAGRCVGCSTRRLSGAATAVQPKALTSPERALRLLRVRYLN